MSIPFLRRSSHSAIRLALYSLDRPRRIAFDVRRLFVRQLAHVARVGVELPPVVDTRGRLVRPGARHRLRRLATIAAVVSYRPENL